MRNWTFRKLQRLAARFGCELVRRPRLQVIRDEIASLDLFAAKSGFLNSRYGGGYHASRKMRSRVDRLSQAVESVSA